MPGDSEFNATLSQIPPGWETQTNAKGCFGFVPDAALGGVLRAVDNSEFQDYVLGGEYEQHQQNLYGDMYLPPNESEWIEDDFKDVEEFCIDW
ncbi:hypothetical protein [Microcoleus sp.]|uniref:hypothetical protein n=1 Tax=Microcoleus sp. TaxID=44472 RepID=UPI003593BF5D